VSPSATSKDEARAQVEIYKLSHSKQWKPKSYGIIMHICVDKEAILQLKICIR
jgi:hypothetical protein